MTQTRRIGLSLGADLCWAACYQEILERLSLHLPIGGDTVDFNCERVRLEPFDLATPTRYDLVFDRITHWFPTTREWIKKIAIADDTYVLNNPWTMQFAEKHTTYTAMMRLGFPIPKTWKDGGHPLFMEPYDGGAWRGVPKIKDAVALHKAAGDSGQQVTHVQHPVGPFDLFVRGLGIGPQVNVIKYDPTAPLHARYVVAFDFLSPEELATMRRMTRVINAFFCWDYNTCEAVRQAGMLRPIDFADASPDPQVTRLHYYFPWVVKSMLKWTLFCAATRRPPRLNPNWAPYFEIAAEDISFSEKLLRYDQLATIHFETDRFEEFCSTHLKNLDEVAWAFFGTDRAKEIFRQKVAALFPAEEVEAFTEHFFGLVQLWRKNEAG